MPPEAFRAFHEATARTLYGYIARVTSSAVLAEDLTQEAYLRLLRSTLPPEVDFSWRRNYLFKIATNLVRDHFRGQRWEELPEDAVAAVNLEANSLLAHDLRQAMAQLSGKERALLWLAYVEKMSHREISGVLGIKEESVRSMLFRARKKMAEVLK